MNQEEKNRYTVSYNQVSMYIEQKLEPKSCYNNTPFAMRIKKSIDPRQMQKFLDTIVERHEMLRVRFGEDSKGEIYQEVLGRPFPYFKFHSVLGWDEISLRSTIEERAMEPFDLHNGPVFRVDLYQVADEDFVLLYNGHHIVVDLWSHAMVFNELCSLWIDGKSKEELKTVRGQYTEFSQAQRESCENSEDEAYWLERLKGQLPIYELPKDRSKCPEKFPKGRSLDFEVNEELSSRMFSLVKELKVTPYIFCFAAYQILLSKYGNEKDMIVGTAMAGRTSSRFRGTIGNFVNTVPIRQFIDGDMSFRDLVLQLSEQLDEAKKHQGYPFAKMVEKLGSQRRNLSHPIFQTYFTWAKPPKSKYAQTSSMSTGGKGASTLGMEPYLVPQKLTQFDLSLFMSDTSTNFNGVFRYDGQLYDDPSIERVIESYTTLFESIVDSPDKAINQLNIVSSNQLGVLEAWQKTEKDFDLQTTLPELISKKSGETPEATALIFGGESLSFSDLEKRTNQMAHWMESQGVVPGQAIAVMAERSFHMVESLIAIQKAGAFYVPIDPGLPESRVKFMLEDCGTTLVLADKAYDKLDGWEGTLFFLSDERLQKSLATHSDQPLAYKPAPNDIAYAIYTSGSTGQPKAAQVEHKSIVNRLLWMQHEYALDPKVDRVLQKTPYSFDVSVWEFFWPLIVGAPLVIAQPGGHKDPDYLAQLICDSKVTTLHFVPPMLGAFLAKEGSKACSSTLKRVICSGEELKLALCKDFFRSLEGVELHNLYGPTEAAVDVTYWHCQPHDEEIPIGRSVSNTQMYVLDNDLKPVPIGVAGEIYIGGVQVARGYINRKELTRERFIENPFRQGEHLYKTGDLGRFRSDGALIYMGRMDFQVKIRGFRIELGEIENAIRRLIPVREAVVTAQELRGEKQLVAYIVAKDKEVIRKEHFVESLKRELPEYMVPMNIVTLDKMPLNGNGKIDRKALPAFEPPVFVEKVVAPQNEVERSFAKVWAELLEVQAVGLETNFFDMGASSLLLSKAQTKIKSDLGYDIPMIDFFRHPTIRSLAQRVNSSVGQKLSVAKPPLERRRGRAAGIERRRRMSANS